MVIHESAENYLETILMLSKRQAQVRSIDIANELNFSKPSVSVALKNLRQNGYIIVNENGHISLTDDGLTIANNVLERHQLITSLFIALGVAPEVAAEDACRMEHVISEESFNALKAHAAKFASIKE